MFMMIMFDPTILQALLSCFGLDPSDWHCVGFGTGLINTTWVLKDLHGTIKYILQKINHQVFKHPEDIAHNLRVVGDHLAKRHPDYLFVPPLPARDGATFVRVGDGDYYRLFPFIGGSRTLDVVHKPEQAFEAARSFARFSHLLADLDPSLLRETLPHFHDLSRRHKAFEDALHKATAARKAEAADAIDALKAHAGYVSDLEALKRSADFPLRVMHHDTKISNILFDRQDKALCVIDLDTVMPGYFISDVGDMMRTYLSPASEEAQDLDSVHVRPEYFRAIVAGYLNGMEGGLTPLERGQFLFAGRFMIYMQALRFLTDHLEGDVYYGARYPGHNLMRARNQVRLLRSFNEAEPVLREMLEALLPAPA
jgi:Ser/Thr protein kinase RdoA (MazF antagonist)